jgi:hypothetical protein
MQGLLDRKLPSCSLLRTVSVETRTPQHKQGHFEDKLLSKTLHDVPTRPKTDPEQAL